MHVSNHLISPESAILGGVIATALIAVAVVKSRKEASPKRLALAGVLGAFVFAAQMFNFPIATIGCSGHLVGGILLAAILGPWLGFLTLSGVLVLQSVLFADGGIMALGWNILNMAALSSLVAYPLIFKPLVRSTTATSRVFVATLLSSIVALTLGALGVVVESSTAGISALPAAEFMGYMIPIHLLFGAIEGIACGAILLFVARREPALLEAYRTRCQSLRINHKRVFATFTIAALVIGGLFSLMASSLPDGLEWSIAKTLGDQMMGLSSGVQMAADNLQQSIALAPDYAGSYTGLVATAGILLITWVLTRGGASRKEEQQRAVAKK